MNRKEILAKWIKALRSGEYIQGHRSLKDIDYFYAGKTQYCALGLLLHTMVDDNNINEHPSNFSVYNHRTSLSDTAETRLPAWLEESLGIYQDAIIALNDSYASFSSIADYIENIYLRNEQGS